MSERMTLIELPGVDGAAYMEGGAQEAERMIRKLRDLAVAMKITADAILSAEDEEFRVTQCLGPLVQRDKKVLQAGRNSA